VFVGLTDLAIPQNKSNTCKH